MSESLPTGNHFGGITKMVSLSLCGKQGIEKVKLSRYQPVTNCHGLPSQRGGQIAPPLDGILTGRGCGEERQLYEKIVRLPTCLEVRP